MARGRGEGGEREGWIQSLLNMFTFTSKKNVGDLIDLDIVSLTVKILKHVSGRIVLGLLPKFCQHIYLLLTVNAFFFASWSSAVIF